MRPSAPTATRSPATALDHCPTGGEPYATVTVSHDLYDNATESVASLSVTGTDTYATSYACTDLNGNTTASVGPMGTAPTCPDTGYTSSVDTTFTTYDPDGDAVQTISPFAASGTQGPTSTSQFDADQSDVLDLSSQGYDVWAANHSATLMGYKTGTLMDDQGNTVATAPEVDTTSSCVDNAADPCADDSVTTYDNQGQELGQASAGNGARRLTRRPARRRSTTRTPLRRVARATSGGGTRGHRDCPVQTTTPTGGHQPGQRALDRQRVGHGLCLHHRLRTRTGRRAGPHRRTPRPRRAARHRAGEATMSYYDAEGNVVARSDPEARARSARAATATRRPRSQPLHDQHVGAVRFTTYSVYNEAGQLTETIEPSASTTTTGYVTAGITTTYSYDPSGNQTTEVNPAGNTVSSTYNGAGRTRSASPTRTLGRPTAPSRARARHLLQLQRRRHTVPDGGLHRDHATPTTTRDLVGVTDSTATPSPTATTSSARRTASATRASRAPTAASPRTTPTTGRTRSIPARSGTPTTMKAACRASSTGTATPSPTATTAPGTSPGWRRPRPHRHLHGDAVRGSGGTVPSPTTPAASGTTFCHEATPTPRAAAATCSPRRRPRRSHTQDPRRSSSSTRSPTTTTTTSRARRRRCLGRPRPPTPTPMTASSESSQVRRPPGQRPPTPIRTRTPTPTRRARSPTARTTPSTRWASTRCRSQARRHSSEVSTRGVASCAGWAR